MSESAPPLCLRKDFTVRERRVAEMIGDGKSYREIARAFNPRLSMHTIRGYVNRMAAKIDVALVDGTRELTPREAVHMFVQYERWARQRPKPVQTVPDRSKPSQTG